MMNPMSWPSQMMGGMMGQGFLQMCHSPMGAPATAGMNMMSSMMGGFTGGMMERQINQEMQSVLSSPSSTLSALDCAKKNPEVIDMMFKAMDRNHRLIEQMSFLMLHNERVAQSMIHLVEISHSSPQRSVGLYLLHRMTPQTFSFLSEALIKYDWLPEKFAKVIKDNAKSSLHFNSHLIRTISYWGHPQHNNDGSELGFEKMIFSMFSHPKAARHFQESLHGQGKEFVSFMFDILMLGQIKYWNPQAQKYELHKDPRQAHRNIHTMIYAMSKMGQKVANGEVKPEVQEQMFQHFMTEHIFEVSPQGQMSLTSWGQNFLQVIVDGMATGEPVISQFAQSLQKKFPPHFSFPSPSENPVPVRPRLMKYLN